MIVNEFPIYRKNYREQLLAMIGYFFTALIWFASDTAHLHTLLFSHITSVVKPVHIFLASGRVSKIRLKTELCFRRYVHLACIPMNIYIIDR